MVGQLFTFDYRTVWYGLLCIRGGMYNGAMFKFTLLIPANYPDGGCPVSHQHIVDLEIVCCWIMVALNYTS